MFDESPLRARTARDLFTIYINVLKTHYGNAKLNEIQRFVFFYMGRKIYYSKCFKRLCASKGCVLHIKERKRDGGYRPVSQRVVNNYLHRTKMANYS